MVKKKKRAKQRGKPEPGAKKCVPPRAVKLIYKRNIRTGFSARGLVSTESGRVRGSGFGARAWNPESGIRMATTAATAAA